MIRRFNSYKHFLTNTMGGRIQKLTLDAGFTCPNRDGTVGIGGCTYCLNDAFNPSYCNPQKSVNQQLEEGIDFHHNRYRRADGYLAYFQAYSNTYDSLDNLKKIYAPAIEHPLVKGIAIGTRPDCMDNEKLDYFAELSRKMFISIEYGVESIYDSTLQKINRGHTFQQAKEAIVKTAERNIHTTAHFIFGLPDETPEMWLNDIATINALPLNAIKFHQLQIIKNTLIADEFHQNPERFYLFDKNSYINFIIQYTERLNPSFIVERFAGEVPPRFLEIVKNKMVRYDTLLKEIETKMEQRSTWQGKYYIK